MKRTLLIVGGISVVLILVGVWAYILFTGTTSDDVSFADLGFGDTTDTTVILPTDSDTVDTSAPPDAAKRLRQLTTKPVVGFTEVTGTDTDLLAVRYIESGTGHIFSINLETGQEQRLSATTIPLASHGVITPNGRNVLIQSDTGARATFIIGTLSSTSDRLSNFALEEPVVDFVATVENELLYAVPSSNSLTVKAYSPGANTTRTLFTVPFRDATIAWHHTSAGPHVVYPKATSRLEGYVYTYTNGTVSRAAANGYGLSAVGSTDGIIYSALADNQYNSFYLQSGRLQPASTPLTFIPEKCTFTASDPTIALCAHSGQEGGYLMPDTWYQGKTIMDDTLWEYDTNRQSARLLVNPKRDSGRQIDLINPSLGTDDNHLYFQNKVDQTLWLYEYIQSTFTRN